MQIGQQVVLAGVPAAVFSDRERFPETYEICLRAVSQECTIRGFNEDGMAELWIDPKGRHSEDNCDDSVWIEPEYLKEVASR